MNPPVNQACLRNQDPILEELSKHLIEPGLVLEVGCGTGQHAVHFCSHLPHIIWQPSDLNHNLSGAIQWQKQAALENLLPVQDLDINLRPWQLSLPQQPRYGYCSNLIHFVPELSAMNVFAGMSEALSNDGLFAIYGPINDRGYTSEGNAQLDKWLKSEIHPQAGIKEITDICNWAEAQGLILTDNILMPANNHLLIFSKFNDS